MKHALWRTAGATVSCSRSHVGRVALSSRVEPLEVHKIHDTIHSFFHVLDSLDDRPLSSLFLPGATLDIRKAGITLSDPVDIDAWCAKMRKGWGDQPTLHTEANIVLSVPKLGVVVSKSVWSAIVGGSLSSYGTHVDTLEAVEGRWLFRQRIVRHLYSAS